MADHSHLHDAEVLLYGARPSGALLAYGCLRGAFDALIAAGVTYAALGMLWWVWQGEFPGVPWFGALYAVCLIGFCRMKYRQWTRSTLRITTERIMLDTPAGVSGIASRTIKWPQFQESFVASDGLLSSLWRAKALCFRYGSSDAEVVLRFPSLRHAKDLKHYLDKADVLIRKNQAGELKPFVEKPRGQRD